MKENKLSKKELLLKSKKKLIGIFVVVFVALVLLFVTGPIFVVFSTKSQFYTEDQINDLPNKDVALVFGAGVSPDRQPTPFLQARLETAVELYRRGKVKKILVSGDNRATNYNEPFVMRQAIIELGVPNDDVVADYAGLDTYDSCYRARNIFMVTNAYVVSQGYHIPRGVFTCSKLGINTTGVSTSRYWHIYGRLVFPNYVFREVFSIDKSLYELYISKPSAAILGNPEPIKY